MSEFRWDPVSDRWVIFAPERAARPTDFPVERRQSVGGFCPFCEGNEDKTPPEIAATREANTRADNPGWRVRVVPNRFPALRSKGTPAQNGDELCRSMNGLGEHEVIIESPKHIISLCEMSVGTVREVFLIYRQRMLSLKADRRLACVVLFKNVGAAAGASLEHSHSQLIATPVVPRNIRGEIQGARRFLKKHGRCVFCGMIEQNLASGERLVAEGEHFVAVAPFASRVPFETWVLPKAHMARFEEQAADTLGDLAQVVRSVLLRLDAALDCPAYNYIIHTAPFGHREEESYHWHIEIIPRVTRIAGFEWGTGLHINPVLPESATAFLRKVKV